MTPAGCAGAGGAAELGRCKDASGRAGEGGLCLFQMVNEKYHVYEGALTWPVSHPLKSCRSPGTHGDCGSAVTGGSELSSSPGRKFLCLVTARQLVVLVPVGDTWQRP